MHSLIHDCRREEVENQTKGLSKKEKKEAELALQQAETELLRNKRRKITVRDFVNVKLIGRGAFGEVCIYLCLFVDKSGQSGKVQSHQRNFCNENDEQRFRNTKESGTKMY